MFRLAEPIRRRGVMDPRAVNRSQHSLLCSSPPIHITLLQGADTRTQDRTGCSEPKAIEEVLGVLAVAADIGSSLVGRIRCRGRSCSVLVALFVRMRSVVSPYCLGLAGMARSGPLRTADVTSGY